MHRMMERSSISTTVRRCIREDHYFIRKLRRPMSDLNEKGELTMTWLDRDGYPTTSALRQIRRWPLRSAVDRDALVETLHELWRFREPYFRCTTERLYLSTGGWSGNEDLIGALQEHTLFWTLCWQKSERGGHYVFDLTRLPG